MGDACYKYSRKSRVSCPLNREKVRKIELSVKHFVVATAAAMLFNASAQAVTLTFDTLPAMANSPGDTVPLVNQLNDAFVSTDGVMFSSAAGYVAVVNHAPAPTVSPPNVIAGVSAAGTLSYGTAIDISFFDPSSPARLATTDFVSIRGDRAPLAGSTATMEIFDISGASLGSVTDTDSSLGLTLTLSSPGIHSVRLTQSSAGFGLDGTIGFDNLEFNAVTAVPLPAALPLFVAALFGLRWRRTAQANGPRRLT
tara:strand:+ start:330 stop:1091 length:762 start_codon:yes stop_codon:yes gene_type:complete